MEVSQSSWTDNAPSTVLTHFPAQSSSCLVDPSSSEKVARLIQSDDFPFAMASRQAERHKPKTLCLHGEQTRKETLVMFTGAAESAESNLGRSVSGHQPSVDIAHRAAVGPGCLLTALRDRRPFDSAGPANRRQADTAHRAPQRAFLSLLECERI